MEKNLSTRELSQIIGCSNSLMSKIEEGDMDPGVLDLVAMARALQKPLEYFGPTYYKNRNKEFEGARQELISSFRDIRWDDLQDLAINQPADITLKRKK